RQSTAEHRSLAMRARMYSRRQFTQLALSAASLPLASRARVQSRPQDSATVRGVKIGAITGVYGPFAPGPGQDVTDVVIARSLEAGIGHVELEHTLYEPRVTGGAVGGQAPVSITPEYRQTRDALRQ